MEVKQQLIQTAHALFMRYGIKSVSMDDIARELGISKKTIYQYVDNKTDLIEQIFRSEIEDDKCMMELIKTQANDAIEEIVKIARFAIKKLRQLSPTTVYDLQKYYLNTWKAMEALHQRHMYQLMRENIELGIRQGVYRQGINPDIIAKLYVAKTSLVADEELFPLGQYNLEELFKEYILYHMHGVASEKGLKILNAHLADLSAEGHKTDKQINKI
ncbi:MAG: TetR/AcrR family transcriptional regulator [Bacteroidota bacterium]